MRHSPPDGHLLPHLLRFTRLLRLMGVRVSLGQTLEWVRAVEVVPITARQDFYLAARALLVTKHEEYPIFDQAFALYWREPEPITVDRNAQAKDNPPVKLARLPSLLMASLSQAEPNEEEERGEERPSYSAIEILRRKDFSEMSWEEIEAAKEALAAMRWPLPTRRTRRMRRAPSGRRLDLRGLIRDNLRYGGEPLRLRWRQRRRKPRPLVVLCDISGSMERYTRLLIHFLHAFSHRLAHTEIFLFGTRLTRITHHLRHRDIDDALHEVSQTVQDWSGGTRIGEALHEFNYRWARRVLGQGAIMLLISDGWDRGDPALLSREMARLQRTSHRLIWLSPLLGSENYQPIQRGIAAALPYTDDFLPVHKLQSLAQLAAALATIAAR